MKRKLSEKQSFFVVVFYDSASYIGHYTNYSAAGELIVSFSGHINVSASQMAMNQRHCRLQQLNQEADLIFFLNIKVLKKLGMVGTFFYDAFRLDAFKMFSRNEEV